MITAVNVNCSRQILLGYADRKKEQRKGKLFKLDCKKVVCYIQAI